jgi:hypothetical protein
MSALYPLSYQGACQILFKEPVLESKARARKKRDLRCANRVAPRPALL